MFKALSIYFELNIAKICLYGFISGMSLLLSGNTINFWLASHDINTKIIGLFSFIALPYALKYFISLIIDNYQISFFKKKNNYKAWLIISQIMIIISLIFTSSLHPHQHLWLIAFSGFFIAFFTTIQDIVLNANRIKLLDERKQAAGSAMYIVGYRLGMLCSGAGVIFMSSYLTWRDIYLILAIIYIILTVILIYIYKEPSKTKTEELTYKSGNNFWYNLFIQPFEHFLTFKKFIWVILFIILYRLADNMLLIMINPFLLQLKFTAIEIARISKFFGTIMVIAGGVLSGPLITKLGLRTSLIYFSLFHAIGHLLFILLSLTGKNIPLLYFITAYEALTSGMVMTGYISFISSLCKGKYVATQYALLSSGIGLSRVIFPISSGVIVDYYGWVLFFITIITISTATTIFTILMPKKLYKI